MTSLSTPIDQFSDDRTIWDSLKQAIANSSGFQRWQLEHNNDPQLQDFSLDQLVRRYLRETLETLAY
ncbi:MAG: hypothetical protein SFY66_05970 [Oculatellaceae cyanobacterium bins.114]|nr:hypothetical protein [Oculatellaceae cyanobacterium bins.114]